MFGKTFSESRTSYIKRLFIITVLNANRRGDSEAASPIIVT